MLTTIDKLNMNNEKSRGMLMEAVLLLFRHCSNMCFEDVRRTITVSVMTSNSGFISLEYEAEKLTRQNMYTYEQLFILNNT
jgi:hypothetical protein